MDRIEPLIEALVLHEAGARVLLEQRVVHGDDHAADIARLERAAERRRELLADDPGDEDMKASLAKTEAQITALRNQPHEPERSSGARPRRHQGGRSLGGSRHGRAREVPAGLGSDLLRRPARRRDAARLAGALSDAFRLRDGDSRLVLTALPALITHAQEWQRVPGAVLPARVAAPGY